MPRSLLGEHDFRAFTPAETQHEVFRRTVLAAQWQQRGDELVFAVEADSFLRHMVRTLVGTMLQTAGGRAPARGLREPARGRAARRGGRHGAAACALPRRRAVRQHKLNVARSTI